MAKLFNRMKRMLLFQERYFTGMLLGHTIALGTVFTFLFTGVTLYWLLMLLAVSIWVYLAYMVWAFPTGADYQNILDRKPDFTLSDSIPIPYAMGHAIPMALVVIIASAGLGAVFILIFKTFLR